MTNARNDNKLHFIAGGNPPVSAGIFTADGKRIAWWPAGYALPEQTLCSICYEMFLARGNEALSREEVRDLIDHPGGLTDEKP